jgi:hypothetical protein
LKHWLSLETKGLEGCCIDWLVWRLTTTIAHFGIKEKGFHLEQHRGIHCESKRGKGGINPTHPCFLAKEWKPKHLDGKKRTTSQCYV